MKVYKLEVIVLGFENATLEEVIYELENTRHIHAQVIKTQEKELGVWDDSNPLNQRGIDKAAYFDSL